MCGLVSSKQRHKEQGEKQAKILQAHQAFCKAYGMQSIDETIEYEPKSSKWTVNVKPLNEMEVYRLELMIHDRKNCRRISEKRLNGVNLMMYSAIHTKDDVVCFLYYSLGNIRNFVRSPVAGLDQINRYHSQLTWENVEIIEEPVSPQVYRGKLSALEFVKRKPDIKPKELAPIEHLPPEILSGKCTIKYSKALTYIVGSMMLELLIDKYMSGVNFQTPKPKLTASSALEHIKQNSKQLATQLASSTLSAKMQGILITFLEYDSSKRCTLSEVLYSVQPPTGYYSTPSFRVISTHPSVTSIKTEQSVTGGTEVDVDQLSVKSSVGSIDVKTNKEGVFVDGVRVIDQSETKHGKSVTKTIKNGSELTTVSTSSSSLKNDKTSVVKSSDNENDKMLAVSELSPASNSERFIDLSSDGNDEIQTLKETAPILTKTPVATVEKDNEKSTMAIKIPEGEVASFTPVVSSRRRPLTTKRTIKRYSTTRKGRKTAKDDELEWDYYLNVKYDDENDPNRNTSLVSTSELF
ncbi:hypothetical protein CHUAL_001983 [Chamberlinius hualienensis]